MIRSGLQRLAVAMSLLIAPILGHRTRTTDPHDAWTHFQVVT